MVYWENRKSLKHQLEQSELNIKQNCLNCISTMPLQVDFKIQTTTDTVALHKIHMQFLSFFTAYKINNLRKGLFCVLANNLLSCESHLPSLSRPDKPKASPLKNILTALRIRDRERWKSKITTKGIKSVIIQISLSQYSAPYENTLPLNHWGSTLPLCCTYVQYTRQKNTLTF